jgi:hypothetical protein
MAIVSSFGRATPVADNSLSFFLFQAAHSVVKWRVSHFRVRGFVDKHLMYSTK